MMNVLQNIPAVVIQLCDFVGKCSACKAVRTGTTDFCDSSAINVRLPKGMLVFLVVLTSLTDSPCYIDWSTARYRCPRCHRLIPDHQGTFRGLIVWCLCVDN